MAYFIDPTGKSTFGIGLCARCSRKFSLTDLSPDPNSPGLMVCLEDLDELDPYRLPARQSERINLDFVRPDVPLTGFEDTESLIYFDLTTEDGDYLVAQDLLFLEVEPWAPVRQQFNV